MVNQLFGNYLVQAGTLTSDQLERAFETQKKVRVKLGLIAVTEKLMTMEQAEEVNKLQAVMDKRFGDIAIEKGYLTAEQVCRLLGLQGNQYLTFAQAVTDNGFLTLREFESAFCEYQRKLEFTSTDMDALKSGDSDRIVPLFLPSGCDGLQVEQVLVAVRTLLRLIDSDAYIGRASRISSVTAKGSALQCIKGDRNISLAIVGDKDAILSLAGVFAREEFDSIDEDALDSVAEFINCVNGLFATGVASKVNLDMLPPVYKEEEVTLRGDNILQLPVYINGKEMQILSTIDGVIEA